MKRNMGNTDRFIRFILALIIAGLYLGGVIPGTLGIVLMVVAIVFLFTGAVNFCPLYAIFGIRTCSTAES